MRNFLSYLAGIILVVVSSLPFINIRIMAPGESFPWIFFLAGTAGFFTLFIRTHPVIKIAAIGGLLNCFLSSAPLLSFIAYFQLLFCCYFFILCTRIRYAPVMTMLQAFLLFNVFILGMQAIGQDPLMNFNDNIYFGTVGQHMQMGSFSVILSACLLVMSPWNFLFPIVTGFVCNSAGAFLSVSVGMMVYMMPHKRIKTIAAVALLLSIVFVIWMIVTQKFVQNIGGSGRLGVWIKSIVLGMEHPIMGYGMGTYKHLFPPLSQLDVIPWKTAHNCWVQIFFETGITGLLVSAGYFCYLVKEMLKLLNRAIYRQRAIVLLSGLAMMATNMMFHFPTRQITTVLLIIFFLAYCQALINTAHREVKNGS